MSENDQARESAQKAYNATYYVAKFAERERSKSLLTVVFGTVAGIGAMYAGINPWLPVIILNGTMIVDAIQKRMGARLLSQAFNISAGNMDGGARAHLREIEEQLRDVPKDFVTLDDFNPVKHWKNKNYIPLAAAGWVFLFATPLLPGAIAWLGSTRDNNRNYLLGPAAVRAKEEMERIYGKPYLRSAQPEPKA